MSRPGARRSLVVFFRQPTAVAGSLLVGSMVVLGLLADVVATPHPFLQTGGLLERPNRNHLLGTDQFGRDMFSAIVHGARASWTLVVCVTGIAFALGLVIGAAAGYRGGRLDSVLMRLADVVQSIPRFFFAILVVTVFGPDLRNLIVLLGLTSWPLLSRVVRAEALSLAQREFIASARASGASAVRIVVRHVLPNVVSSAVVVAALVGSRVILIEAGLAFLGLTDPKTMSWGLLVRNAESYVRVAWWLSVFPGLAIASSVLGLNLISDGLNDVLDPAHGPNAALDPYMRSQS